MCYLLVRDGGAVLVDALNQVPDHVGAFVCAAGPAVVDDVHVDRSHAGVGGVALSIVWQWKPWEHEVDGSEAFIEIMV